MAPGSPSQPRPDRWVRLERGDGSGGPVVAWLEPDDVSLTYSAARREVTRHASGRGEVVGDDLWTVLEREVAAGGDWYGYLGYACRSDLPARPSADVPDAVWMRPSRRLVGGLLGREWNFSGTMTPRELPSTRLTGYSSPAPSPAHDPAPAAYAAAFARVQEALHAGDTYEANLTYRIEVEAALDPVALYDLLCATSPAPYAGLLAHDVPGASAWLLSASPERFARVEPGGWVETRPIKGTTPRSADPAEDAAHARRLARDERYRAENLMILDLLRNDLATVCAPGTVTVPDLMRVESYTSVHQLVSTVRGRLRPGIGTVAALRALFPAGSMTGAPKRRTMALIDEVEDTPRGAYAGAFGRIGADGTADLGVVIRTLTSPDARHWSLGTGGGITVHSDADGEYAETRWKADRLLTAVAQAANGHRGDGAAGGAVGSGGVAGWEQAAWTGPAASTEEAGVTDPPGFTEET